MMTKTFTLLAFIVTILHTQNAEVRANTDVDDDHTVCYPLYGCFSVEPPFSPKMPLPMDPEKIHTKFLLHTRPNTTEPTLITPDRESIEASNFDPSKPTKMVIHGFVIVQGLSGWMTNLTEAILTHDNVNVIIVNWVGGAQVAYDQAVSNTRLVGAQMAHLIRVLMEIYDSDPKDFHLIGFSLGAHVAGFAGKELKRHNADHMIGRITGLDPANPGFDYDANEVRLDRTDADFVDVIHTDTSTMLVVASGINRNLGHADYYPNGGASQPGCNTWTVTGMTVCDHVRSPLLFMNSINATSDCHFAAYRCSSYEKFELGRCIRCAGKKSQKRKRTRCSQMGYWAQPPLTKKPVKYYLKTSDSAPFCVKHYQVQMHWRKGPGSTKYGFKAHLFVTLHGDKGSTEEIALNNGASFVVAPGNTSRFLVSQDCKKDIGTVDRVTFRWKRPFCWSVYFCSKENVYIKRLKVVDAVDQKRLTFYPLPMDQNKDGRKDIIEISEKNQQDLFRKSYIRSQHPEKFVGRSKSPRKLEVPVLMKVISNAEQLDRERSDVGLVNRLAKRKRHSHTKKHDLQYLEEENMLGSPPAST